MKVSELKTGTKNPRKIKGPSFEKLKKSIQEFPKMMELRQIVYNPDTMEVLGGNMRLKAIKELGMKEIPDTWVRSAADLTDDERKRFVITDNVGFGEWDEDILKAEWGDLPLDEWGLELPKYDGNDKDLSNSIISEFRIEIICHDEKHQEQIFNDLKEQGYECRILTL